jgi:hypothetical protein
MFGILAEATPPPAQNNFGDTMSDGLAGPTALLIIVLLAIATVLLVRNMNGRLRRLPASFPVPGAAAQSGIPAQSGVPDRAAADPRDGAGRADRPEPVTGGQPEAGGTRPE